MHIRRHRLAKGENAGCGRVAMLAIAQGLDRRFHDMAGGWEIRLADSEIDDVAALAGKFGRAGEDRKGVLLADAGEGGDDIQHELPLSGLFGGFDLGCGDRCAPVPPLCEEAAACARCAKAG